MDFASSNLSTSSNEPTPSGSFPTRSASPPSLHRAQSLPAYLNPPSTNTTGSTTRISTSPAAMPNRTQPSATNLNQPSTNPTGSTTRISTGPAAMPNDGFQGQEPKYGGKLYNEGDNFLKSIQKCTFMVFTAVFLVVTFLHGSNYAGTCQPAEYGPSMNSKFYDAACSAARADIITLIMTIQFLYVLMYLFCESHRNIKSELVMEAAAKKNPDFAVQEIQRSGTNKLFTCCILSCSNELFLLITYIFVASSIVSVLTIHANYKDSIYSIFRLPELSNPRTERILPPFFQCTIGGMPSFSDAMNSALSALQLKRPEQSQGVTVTVMCFVGFAITLRLTTFFLIVYLYSASLIIFILMVVKLFYYAYNVELLVYFAVLQEMA